MKRQQKLHRTRTGQTWSTDLLLAAGLFLLTFAVFYYILGTGSSDTNLKNLKEESNLLPLKLISGDGENSRVIFIIDNKVDTARLHAFANLSYTDIKNMLGLTSDFCIYFEDKNGNLINISKITGKPNPGIGSSRLNISNMPCGGP
ncbi:MAG: hypothetical protein GXP63_04600 [DPANN group archaeon]|nr:hypothetical protein [DPANN group archaeon]